MSSGHKENPKSKQNTKKKEKKIPLHSLTSWADDVDETVAKGLEPKHNPQKQEQEQAPSSPSYPREERRSYNTRKEGGEGEGSYSDRRGGYNDRRGGGSSYERRGGYNDRRGGERRNYEREGGGERRNYEREGGGERRNYEREGGERRGGSYERRGGYNDRRGGGSSYERRAPEEEAPEREKKPIPNEPPFTAYVGNLAYECTEGDLRDFFKTANCSVVNIKLVPNLDSPNQHKGFGYVEFETKEDLVAALQGNNYDLKGRLIRIDVAERPEKKISRAETSEKWDRKESSELQEEDKHSPFGGRRNDTKTRNYNFHDSNYNNNRSERHRNSEETSSREEKKERPKLNLKPRTNPEPVASAAQITKTDPFGGAKPRDEKQRSSSSSSSSPSSSSSSSAVSPTAQRKEEEKPQPPKESHVSETKPAPVKTAASKSKAPKAKSSQQENNPYGALDNY